MLADVLWMALGAVLCESVTRIFRKPKPPKSRPVIHCRGTPGWYAQRVDGQWVYRRCAHPKCNDDAAFVDSRMREWCELHVPEDEAQVERGTHVGESTDGTGHADGICKVHGIDCPKPWAVREGL